MKKRTLRKLLILVVIGYIGFCIYAFTRPKLPVEYGDSDREADMLLDSFKVALNEYDTRTTDTISQTK